MKIVCNSVQPDINARQHPHMQETGRAFTRGTRPSGNILTVMYECLNCGLKVSTTQMAEME